MAEYSGSRRPAPGDPGKPQVAAEDSLVPIDTSAFTDEEPLTGNIEEDPALVRSIEALQRVQKSTIKHVSDIKELAQRKSSRPPPDDKAP